MLHGCAGYGADGDGLYRALGQRDGIEALTGRFLYHLADNEQALPLFLNTDIERFHAQFSAQLCAVAGGPCVYEGDTMEATHRGMNISRAQFNSVVDDLIAAMEDRGISVSAQNALLARLAPMYSDIAGM